MKKTIKLVAFVLLLAVVATSCKKYPEGPALSLRSKKARVAGDWTIESVKVNDVDFTSLYSGSGFKMTITKDGNYSVTSNGTETDAGTWKFGDKKETFVSTSTKTPNSKAETGDILKLENKSLWIKTTDTDNGTTNVTEIHYKQ